jgi:hypothetical protein
MQDLARKKRLGCNEERFLAKPGELIIIMPYSFVFFKKFTIL